MQMKIMKGGINDRIGWYTKLARSRFIMSIVLFNFISNKCSICFHVYQTVAFVERSNRLTPKLTIIARPNIAAKTVGPNLSSSGEVYQLMCRNIRLKELPASLKQLLQLIFTDKSDEKLTWSRMSLSDHWRSFHVHVQWVAAECNGNRHQH